MHALLHVTFPLSANTSPSGPSILHCLPRPSTFAAASRQRVTSAHSFPKLFTPGAACAGKVATPWPPGSWRLQHALITTLGQLGFRGLVFFPPLSPFCFPNSMTAKKETRVRSVTSLERSTFRPKTDHRHAGSPSLPRPVPREAAWLLALWARPTPTPSLPPQDRNHVSVAKRESPTSLEDTIGDTHEITLTFSAIEIEELEREERKMGLVGFFFFFFQNQIATPGRSLFRPLQARGVQ